MRRVILMAIVGIKYAFLCASFFHKRLKFDTRQIFLSGKLWVLRKQILYYSFQRAQSSLIEVHVHCARKKSNNNFIKKKVSVWFATAIA